MTPEQELEVLRTENAELRTTLQEIRNIAVHVPVSVSSMYMHKARVALERIEKAAREVLKR